MRLRHLNGGRSVRLSREGVKRHDGISPSWWAAVVKGQDVYTFPHLLESLTLNIPQRFSGLVPDWVTCEWLPRQTKKAEMLVTSA